MPRMTGRTNSRRDQIERAKNTAPLGGYLEWRTRNRAGGTNTIRNYSHFASGKITTTRRTFGMPESSTIVNFGHFPETATIIQVASTSNNDIGPTGTGAHSVTIIGFDADWEPLTETEIVLNGQTPVTSTNEFFRINRVFIDEHGSREANDGDLYFSDSTDTFTLGIPDNRIINAMQALEGVSSFGNISFGAHIRQHYIKGNIFTNVTPSNPFLLEERYTFDSFKPGARVTTSAGPLWVVSNTSYGFEGAVSNEAKTDQEWIVSAAVGTVEGTIYYELADQDLLFDHFDVNIN